jgi:hypothetical protein
MQSTDNDCYNFEQRKSTSNPIASGFTIIFPENHEAYTTLDHADGV